jgi:serine/threonine protein kinase
MSLASNQQLFEYRIKRVLGQGAFGTVYLAHDTLLEQAAAGLRGRAGRLLRHKPCLQHGRRSSRSGLRPDETSEVT